MKRVIVESPYAGDVAINARYLRSALRHCLLRGESPIASHGLLAQSGVLDDSILAERELGIEAGFAWREAAEITVVYTDLGVSRGMHRGIRHALSVGEGEIESRTLPDWDPTPVARTPEQWIAELLRRGEFLSLTEAADRIERGDFPRQAKR